MRIIIIVTITELIVLVSKGLRNCCTIIMLTIVVNIMPARPPIPIRIMIEFRTWDLAGEVDGIDQLLIVSS